MKRFARSSALTVYLVPEVPNLNIEVTEKAGDESSKVDLQDSHMNIKRIEKNSEVIFAESSASVAGIAF